MTAEVRDMFAAIAPRYDVTNDVLSLGLHRRWRRQAVSTWAPAPGSRVLDVACGTGDLALELKRRVGAKGEVVGTDFCPQMLEVAPAKAARAGLEVRFRLADALDLPFADGSFDAATIAFGIRNVADPGWCLRELARVVRRGGVVGVLEFGQPTGLFGAAFRFYSRWCMPWLGGALTGTRSAYEYLPRTAASFPAGGRFVELMERTGLLEAPWARPLLFGTAYVYTALVR